MRIKLETLLLFLFPALIALVFVALLHFYSLHQFSQHKAESQKVMLEKIEDFRETIGFIETVGQQYKRLNQLLLDSNKGQLSQAQAYRFHTKMLDKLALTEARLLQVKNNIQLLPKSRISVQEWHQHFSNFKNFSMMASDIVVIDPKTSEEYIKAAQVEYFKFVDASNKISKDLAAFTNETLKSTNLSLEESLNTTHYLGMLGLLFALLIAVFLAARLSHYLQIILVSLRDLANFKKEIPQLKPVELMLNSTTGELNLLARAILKFKTTLETNLEEEAKIYQLAYFDELTNLPNMQRLRNDLQSLLSDSNFAEQHGVLIKLNINRFKVFNNAMGYSFGNALLQAFAKRLNQLKQPTSTLYRGSADEFYILIQPNKYTEAELPYFLEVTIDRIKKTISEPISVDSQLLTIRCNQGLVAFPISEHSAPNEVLLQSMIALHHSKELGSNQAAIYETGLSKKVTDFFELEKDLKQALNDNQLAFYLQPQVHPQLCQPHAEALIRWQHPTRGWIRPDIMIEMAEKSDLIIEVDKWMLTQVCQFVTEQTRVGQRFHVSINISGHHFSHPSFINHVEQIFAQTGVDPKQITLELTENVFLENFSSVISKMQHLKSFGVNFSIDDFGTGYSSLSYLKRLPVDEIKIDRAFVINITENQEDQTLVKAMFEMAQTFDLKVVVEGVETPEQAQVLQQFGEPIIQGYLYAKPLPPEEWLISLSQQTLPNKPQ